jgi:hypothetical protein
MKKAAATISATRLASEADRARLCSTDRPVIRRGVQATDASKEPSGARRPARAEIV